MNERDTFMKQKTYNLVQNKNELGYISVSADIALDIDQEGYENRHFQSKAFFNPLSWETELVWQVVQMISEYHKDETVAMQTVQEILEKLKEKAKDDGIPYQTLISMVLHKYITNQLLEKSELLKSIQILRNKEGV